MLKVPRFPLSARAKTRQIWDWSQCEDVRRRMRASMRDQLSVRKLPKLRGRLPMPLLRPPVGSLCRHRRNRTMHIKA